MTPKQTANDIILYANEVANWRDGWIRTPCDSTLFSITE